MWANRVVFDQPLSDDSSGLDERFERPPVQTSRSKNAVEAFVVGVLPRAARVDVVRSHRTLRQPALDALGNELGSIVAAQTIRLAVLSDQLVEDTNNIGRRQTPRTANGQALARKLVDHRQTLQRPTIDRLILDEVVAPDMVRMLGSMHPGRLSPRNTTKS